MSLGARPEHIAVVTTSFPRFPGDAAGHFVLAEVRELERQGARVTVIAAGDSAAPPAGDVHFVGGSALFDWPGALPRLRERPLRGLLALTFVVRSARLLAQLGPFDRVISHWLLPSALPPLVTWPLGGAPRPALEVVLHGSDARLLARLPRRARGPLLRELARRGARLRFVSRTLRDELARSSGLGLGLQAWLEKSEVRPAALDITFAPSRAEARDALGVTPDERLVVVVGRLVPEKRTHVALSAASLVPDARVVVVGAGPERERLARELPEAVLVGQVPREVALRWIAAADLLLSASREEGAPTAIREARALDVPVVARAAGDLERWSVDDPELWVL